MKTYKPCLEPLEGRLVPSALHLNPHFGPVHHKPIAPGVKVHSVILSSTDPNIVTTPVTALTATEGHAVAVFAIPDMANGTLLVPSQIQSVGWSSSDPTVFVSPEGTRNGDFFTTAIVGLNDFATVTATITCTVTDINGNVATASLQFTQIPK